MEALAFEAYLDAASEDVERIASVDPALLGRSVPACPGWTVSDVVSHLAQVYAGFLERARSAQQGSPGTLVPARVPARAGARAVGNVSQRGSPDGGLEALERLEIAWARLREQLEALGEHAACDNFTGKDRHLGWVARRMAHETAVHRFDIEAATGAPGVIEVELALDGIGELLEVMLPRGIARALEGSGPHPVPASLGGSLGLVANDADAAFLVELRDQRLSWRPRRSPANAVVVGSASELFLFSWRRVPLEALALTGERAIAEAWTRLPGV